MEKVILFKKGIETLEFFSKEMGKAFEKMGLQVFYYDLDEGEKSLLKLEKFVEKGESFVISFNFNGLRGEEELYNEDGKLFWKVKGIPCVNIMVDHPFYYAESLEKVRSELGWDLYYQISIDRDHKKYLERFYPQIDKICFMPLAGTGLGKSLNNERKYDVVFTGNYTPPKHFEKYIERVNEEYTAFYKEIIEYLICNPETTMENAFEKFLLREMPELTNEELVKCMENMIFIDLYVRFYYRGEVVKKLIENGIEVHVFGSNWEFLETKNKDLLHIEGIADSRECLVAMTKAKIALNVMPWFKEGAHDRVFNGMLNGAVVLTDKSGYLCKELARGEVSFYSLEHLEELPGKVKELLENEEKQCSMRECAYLFAKKSHTWENRAQFIYEWVTKILSDI